MIPADRKPMPLDRLISAITTRRREISPERALLVGISGIDASGKGFVTQRIAESLGARPAGVTDPGYNVAVIGADGWLNLPDVRFNRENPAAHFYEHAFRFDEMFETLVLPLKQNRTIDLQMDYTEETATSYRKHRFQFRAIDVILLEGIFLLKKSLRQHFDLTCWVECSFQIALVRALERRQEGLPPSETVDAFSTIYFPAQQIHFERDAPLENTDLILRNEGATIAKCGAGMESDDFSSQATGDHGK
jgi:uridine kinase